MKLEEICRNIAVNTFNIGDTIKTNRRDLCSQFFIVKDIYKTYKTIDVAACDSLGRQTGLTGPIGNCTVNDFFKVKL